MKSLSTKRLLLIIFVVAVLVFLAYCAVIFKSSERELTESNKETVTLKLMLYLDKLEDNTFKIQLNSTKYLAEKNPENLSQCNDAREHILTCLTVLDSVKRYNVYLNKELGILDSLERVNLTICGKMTEAMTGNQLNIYYPLSDKILKAFKLQIDKVSDYGRVILHEYKNNHDEGARHLSRLFIILFITGGVIIILLFIKLWDNIKRQGKLEMQLSSFNTELEKQIADKSRELFSKKRRLEAIYESAQAFILELDLNKRILFINKPRKGYDMEFYNNIYFPDLVLEKDLPAVENAIDSVIQNKKSYSLKYSSKDNTIHYWSVFMPIVENGKVTSVMFTAHDITELINKQEELSVQNTRLETIYNAVQVYIVELDLQKTVRFVNKTRRGFTKDSVIGTPIIPTIYAPDRERFERVFESVIQTKTQTGLNYSVGDGSLHYWGILTPVITEGKVSSVLLTVHDITDLIVKQEILMAQNNKLDAIYNNTSALICELSLDEKVMMLNKGNQERPVENYIGKTLTDIFGKEQGDKFHLVIGDVIAKKKTNNFEFYHKRKDGTMSYFTGAFAPIMSEDKVSSVLMTAVDISELKAKQKELDRLAEIFELSPTYKAIADKDLNFISGNKALRKILEINEDDITQYKVSDFRNLKGEMIIENVYKELEEKGKWQGENYYVSKSGKEIPVLQGIILHRDEEGNTEYISSTAIDLTALKEKEKEAVIFKRIIDESVAFFAITEMSSKLIFLNNAAKKLLELNDDEDITQLYLNDFRPEKGTILMEEIRKELFNEGRWIGETYYQSRSGKEITAFAVLALHRNDHNEPEYIMGTCLDITDQIIAAENVRKLNEDLNELANSLNTAREDERAEIAREIHDELGQHLTLLKMNAYWIKNHFNSEDEHLKIKIEQMLEATQNTIDTNRKLINTLHPSMLDEIGLSASLEWHLKAFNKSTGIKTNLDISRNLNFEKKVNLCVYRIIQESLTNVIRYAKAGEVDIFVKLQNEELTVIVKDNGEGFDTGITDVLKSHGLKGMRERVIALNGTLNISSAIHKGTTIEAMIPDVKIYMPD